MKEIDEVIDRLTNYKDKLEKENRVLSYWENEFKIACKNKFFLMDLIF